MFNNAFCGAPLCQRPKGLVPPKVSTTKLSFAVSKVLIVVGVVVDAFIEKEVLLELFVVKVSLLIIVSIFNV